MDQRVEGKRGIIVVYVGSIRISGAMAARGTFARILAIGTTTSDVKFCGFVVLGGFLFLFQKM
jgi:hypothetical protein